MALNKPPLQQPFLTQSNALTQPWALWFDYVARTSGTGGGGDTTNNYSSIKAPQIFNPDASGVSGGTDNFTLSSGDGVVLVAINGQVLDDSEYSLAGVTLTVTPDNGFSSTSDEVLVFQETFTSTTTGRVKETLFIVQEASELASIDSTLTYYIDGAIDMGTQSIEVPAGGVKIISDDLNKKGLYSTEDNYTMFTTPSGGYAGRLDLENMFVAASGTNSKLFDLDNDGNNNEVALIDTNIGNFGYGDTTEIGEITDYRQFRAAGCGFINCDDGLTFNGTMSGGIVVQDSIALSLPAMTLFKEGASLLVQGSVRSNMNFLSVDASAVAFDFDDANVENDGGFDLLDFRTVATDSIPNIDSGNVKARFKDCLGIRNTYVGGQWKITTETTTTISTVNTPVKLAGTTTYSDVAWFNGDVDNAFEYESSQPIEIQVTAAFSLSGSNGDQINIIIRKWDDSASGYVDVSESGAITMNSAGRAEGVSVFGFASMDEDDRIEIWVENQTDTSNVTALLGGLVAISERAS